jgi:hypothetical protein
MSQFSYIVKETGHVLYIKIHFHVLLNGGKISDMYNFYFSVGPSLLTVDPPPMVNDNINPDCYNFTHGNYHNMEFYSPGYPSQYPNNIDCVMYLQGMSTFYSCQV